MASRPRIALLRWIEAIPAKAWVVVALAVALGASALFGGLDDAAPRTDPAVQLGVGETFDGTRFTTTITGAELLSYLPGTTLEPDDEGNVYLMVTAVMTNEWRMTSSITDVITLEGVPEELATARSTVQLSDLVGNVRAQPGVPTEVGLVWELPASYVTVGEAVRVNILNQTLVTKTYLVYGDYWTDPVLAAWVPVPVVDSTVPVVDE